MNEQLPNEEIQKWNVEIYNEVYKQEKEDIIKIMDHACLLLNRANEHYLGPEVMVWALKYMKDNPNLTIIEALNLGYDEWIK